MKQMSQGRLMCNVRKTGSKKNLSIKAMQSMWDRGWLTQGLSQLSSELESEDEPSLVSTPPVTGSEMPKLPTISSDKLKTHWRLHYPQY